jgi:hypothetical protein
MWPSWSGPVIVITSKTVDSIRDGRYTAERAIRTAAMPNPEPTTATPAQRVVASRCQHCGGPFDAVRPHQVFCRPSCRWEAFKAKREIMPRQADPILFDV